MSLARPRDLLGFVGVEAIVADGLTLFMQSSAPPVINATNRGRALLAFRRDVLNGRSEKVGGFENFEVAFGVPTVSGTADDRFGVGIPSDFLEGEGGAE